MEFTTEEELRQYVEEAIVQVAPSGWEVRPGRERPLSWVVCREHSSGAFDDYQISVTRDPRMILIVHGNSDQGPLRLEQCLVRSTVIQMEALRFYPLQSLLAHVFEHERPNSWGLT
jgi:hypothetical protein